MNEIEQARQAEKDKYNNCYKDDRYHMGIDRKDRAKINLKSIENPNSYLDVGCGRGEMLTLASNIGFDFVQGVEVVDYLIDDDRVVKGSAYDIPFDDNTFQVVSLFDVIEHLLPDDAEPTCRELERVAIETVFITANNRPSYHNGIDLHIHRLDYETWDAFFKKVFSGKVTWLKELACKSETWRIDFD